MRTFIKYDNTKTFMYPNGEVATPERVLQDFPATAIFTHIIETDSAHQVLFSMDNLSSVRDRYNIYVDLTDDEAIMKINEIINEPAPTPDPTAEERIAAAMEFQNLMSL